MNTSTTSETDQFPSPDELRRNREERNRLESEIAELSARQSTAADLERIARAWRLCDRQQEGREDAKRRRNQELSIYPDVDGMFVVRGLLTPEVGAVVRRSSRQALGGWRYHEAGQPGAAL